MEEQDTKRSESYVINRAGKFFKIFNKENNKALQGSFTTLTHAQRYLDAYVRGYNHKLVQSEIKRIRNSDKPVKQKMKEYKQLCQQIQELS